MRRSCTLTGVMRKGILTWDGSLFFQFQIAERMMGQTLFPSAYGSYNKSSNGIPSLEFCICLNPLKESAITLRNWNIIILCEILIEEEWQVMQEGRRVVICQLSNVSSQGVSDIKHNKLTKYCKHVAQLVGILHCKTNVKTHFLRESTCMYVWVFVTCFACEQLVGDETCWRPI